jgi:RNA polymerase sigma-70 factor (ECF subfamily)
MSPSGPHPSPASAAGRFATTHWSVIVAAREGDAAEAREALATLFRTYWYPLYAFIRREGHSADQAQDLTQGFFAELLEPGSLAAADRARGKFRSYLLGACKHYLSHERERARARKRGGGHSIVSLDLRGAEDRYTSEPAHNLTPEKLFDRRWAMALLDRVFGRLREEFAQKGKDELFDRLRLCLLGEKEAVPYGKVARELGMSEGSVKVAAHRLRRRFREVLHEEIGRTVDDPADVADEIRELFAALAP